MVVGSALPAYDLTSFPRFAGAFAIVVADHGAYIWGDDVLEAKRHTEVYHFLFEATVARHDRSARLKEGRP